MAQFKSRSKAGESDLLFRIWQNKSVLFLCFIFVLGVMLGSFTACKSHDNAVFGAEFTESFFSDRHEQKIEKTFFSALTPNIIAWAAIFLCGFCAVSAPIILLILLIRAAGYGVLAGCLLLHCQQNALRYMLLILLPNTVISALTLIFCCREAVIMSRLCWESMTSAPRSDRSYMTVFCGKMLLYAILLIAGAALESYSHILFF